ncbi:MAG: hypothetical protein SFU86_17660 [Pirellulaceae bacterium]|nr:hypothetical protein [Pirellulaceae bacterium]
MTVTSKWTAFLLSALVPGAGQLAAKSWTCVAWFLAAGLLAAAAQRFGDGLADSMWLTLLPLVGIALSLASGEHAKRLLEGRSHQPRVTRAEVTCAPSRGRSLNLAIELEVNQSAAELWRAARDLPRFLTLDPFHDEITLMRAAPAAGVDLVLSHNAFGRRFLRFGRIIAWREGAGYSFSDLSPRGPRVGFPHVFVIEVAESPPIDGQATKSLLPASRSRLTIRVRGRWTSRLVPVGVGRLWVWLVCREHARLLRKGL